MNRGWSAQQVETLQRGVKSNTPIKTIASLVGKEPCTVYNEIWKRGMGRKRGWQKGIENPNWRGGRRITVYGYVEIYMPLHHRARKTGYVYEHILIAEEKIGMPIEREMHVHHLNRIRSDNRPENLEVLSARSHHQIHAPKKRGTMINCPVCETPFYAKPVEIRNRTRVTCSRACANKYRHFEEVKK